MKTTCFIMIAACAMCAATVFSAEPLTIHPQRAIQTTIPTSEGFRYQLETSTNLTDWAPASDIRTACSSNMEFSLPAAQTQQFLRAAELAPLLGSRIIGLTNMFADAATFTLSSNSLQIAGFRVESRDYKPDDYLNAIFGFDPCRQAFALSNFTVITNLGMFAGRDRYIHFFKDVPASLRITNGNQVMDPGTTYSIISTGQVMTVHMESAQVLSMVATPASTSYRVIYRDPEGSIVGSFDWPTTATIYHWALHAFQSGSHSIQFVPLGASSVSLKLRFVNGNRRTTPVLGPNQTFSVKLEDYYNDYAKFAVPVAAGKTVTVSTPVAPARIRVCSSRGRIMDDRNASGSGLPFAYLAPESDTYFFIVYHELVSSVGQTFNYSTTVQVQ